MWILAIFFLGNFIILIFNQILVDISGFGFLVVAPILLVREFGLATFTRNIGLLQVGWAISSYLLELIFGLLYDSHVSEGSYTCYGLGCFTEMFIIAAILNISVLPGLIYMIKIRWKGQSKDP